MRLVVAVSAAIAALAVVAPSRATDVTLEQVRELAARAVDEPPALAELRRVDSVAGRPIDVERLLAGAEGDELAGRLRVLAEETSGAEAGDAAAARRQARSILAARRFQEPATARPLRSPLEWLRDRLRSGLDPIISRIAPHVPGGDRTVWTVLALLTVVLAAVLGSRLVRRRAAATPRRRREALTRSLDPGRLEREADEAERRGDLERALRLRFRAGLLRLQRAEAIPARDSLTSGEVARRLRSPDFDRLAATFDEVVYGGRQPERSDLELARSAWPRVLSTAGAA